MKTFFTSDWHLNFCFRRPFKSPEHYAKRIIDGVNQRCKPEDVLWILGDVINRGYVTDPQTGERYKGPDLPLEHYLAQINCKVMLLKGNHCVQGRAKTHAAFAFVEVGKHLAFLSHYPTTCPENELFHRNHQGKWRKLCETASICCSFALVGHQHLAPQVSWDKRLGLINMNVSPDVNNWLPVSHTEILARYDAFVKTT